MDADEPRAKKCRNANNLPVVLGTSSKWRRSLFEKHFPDVGATAEFMSPNIDEKAIRREKPDEMTVAIAHAKADALLSLLKEREALLVTMDQVVCCEGMVREKPENEEEARSFLKSYQEGKGACCVNGMVVHNTVTGKRVTAVAQATVYWKPFPDSVVDHLVSKGDVFTTAGGFVVEDPELQPYRDRLEGTIDCIEGLPVKPLRELLRRAVAPSVTHVLFDMDGLLLDTESSYTVAQQKIVGRWGKTFTWDLNAKMMAKKAVEAAQILIDDLDLQDHITAEQFVIEREQLLDELFARAELLPGVKRLIRHLHACKVPMAVATSSHRRHFELKTTLHRELFGLMHHIVTGDEVIKSKPDPEIFNVAAKLFDGTPPEASRVLVFEDAPTGVQAGLGAGMQVCHVPDTNLSCELRGNSHCELKSLELFNPEEWGLTPF